MTTLVQYLPPWLRRSRWQKPANRTSTALNKKKRQILPTLPNLPNPRNRAAPAISAQNASLGPTYRCGACNQFRM